MPAATARQFDARWLMEMLALAALYFLTARLGLLLAVPGGHVTPVWPPSGIALGAILLRGRRVWPGIWLGSFTANLWDFYGSPPSLATELATSAAIGIGASLAALAAAFLLLRFVGGRNPLERVRDVCAFMALGGVVSCLISATVGMTTLCLAGFAPWSGYGQAWLTWWLGDTAGVFTVAPLLLVWGGARWFRSGARWVEFGACFGLLLAVTFYVFIGNTTARPIAFLPIPLLVWSAVRFGQRGAVVAVGLIWLLAVWGTIHNTGPFNFSSRNESLLLLELFLSVVVLTALCMAATVTEREQAEAAQQRAMVGLELRVLERTAALTRSESQARQHLAEAERARAALLSILEDERATEDALRASEGRFRTIFEQAPLGIAEGEITTARFVSVNKRCADILGYAIDELRELTFKDYTHPEDLHKDLVEFDKLALGEIKTYEMEKRYIRKDGAIIWVNLTVSALAQTGEMPLNCIAVIDDITARKLAEQKVAESSEQLRALLKRLQQAQEDERIRVAREIHDELGQLLTGLKMDVRWLERKLADPSLPPALNPLLDRAVAASDMADQTIAVVQKIAAELRPGALDRLGLAAALTQKARRFQERTGIRCQVALEESETALSAEIATELFYICQEALTNVARHAHATEVQIRFETNENGVVLEVRDNGGGMAEADFLAPHSLGLLGMRERASHCAGRVVWERCVPQGTRVTVHIPYDGAVTKQGEPL